MNKKINDGGLAFPGFEHFIGTENTVITGKPHRGMSLRDYFAGQSLMGLRSGNSSFLTPENMAELAYKDADAMIKAREGGV